MSSKPVVVYGASGYTGRLVCEYLRELNVPFVAAGRDKDRVQEVVGRIPGIETADVEVVQVDHTVEALTDLLTGARVVCNTVGPFISHGPQVAEAALAAGCHYLDVTGEQDWLLDAQSRYGAAYADRGLLLAPGIAQPRTSFEVGVPGTHEIALAAPWGGTSHPVWFKDDPRVANVKVAGGVLNRPVMEAVVATTAMVEDEIKTLPRDQWDARLSEVAQQWQSGMPPRENPRLNTSVESVHASGPLGRKHVVLHGNCNDKQTGLLQAWAAMSLLQQAPQRVGLASGCQAFGHRQLLGVLRSFGLVLDPVVTEHR